MKFTEKLKKLTKFAPVVSFLALEVFAILAFSLGNNFVLFGSLSLALFVILLIFSYGEVKREGLEWKTEYKLQEVAFGIKKILIGVILILLKIWMKMVRMLSF